MKKLALIALATLTAMFFSGCGMIEDQIDKLTSKDLEMETILYDGSPEEAYSTAVVAEVTEVSSGQTNLAGMADLTMLDEQIQALTDELDPLYVLMNGSISNTSSERVYLTLYLSPDNKGANGAEQIGSVTIPAKTRLEIVDNEGFDEKPEFIDQVLLDFFAANPTLERATLFVDVEGAEGGLVDLQFDYLQLDFTPMYRNTKPLHMDWINSYKDNLKSIGKVSMSGVITNRGNDVFHFIYLVSFKDQNPDFDYDVVLEGDVEPGQSVRAADLLVKNGMAKIKQAMLNSLEKGSKYEDHIFILSNEQIDADIDRMAITAEVTVGLM